MPQLSVLFKTVSTDCNLDCSYCYYRQSSEGTRVRRRTEEPVLSAFMSQYMDYVADARVASIGWQGGEPTLAGTEFFERVVSLEAENAHDGTTIGNALQTNGVLLDDRWAEFLARYRFLVGVSLDGPAEIHDSQRRDRGGHGSFRRVMAGIETLRRHGVEFNVLCVVGPHNVQRVRELMAFFRSEGFPYLQFIPAMGFQAAEPDVPPSYLITAEEYGQFLTGLFDEWYEDGFPTVSVRTFDAFVQSYLGRTPELCVHGERCDSGIVVEHNGDIYPCDFYVDPRYRLGNILQEPLASILAKPERAAFIGQKRPLPTQCEGCEWLSVCRGGCPRNRVRRGASPSVDYFCESYRRLLSYAGRRLTDVKDRLERRTRTLRDPGGGALERNERCPCGSGRKYKACCGHPRIEQSYLLRG